MLIGLVIPLLGPGVARAGGANAVSCPAPGQVVTLDLALAMSVRRPDHRIMSAVFAAKEDGWRRAEETFIPRFSVVAEQERSRTVDEGNDARTVGTTARVGSAAVWRGPLGTQVELFAGAIRNGRSRGDPVRGPAASLSLRQPLLKGAGSVVGRAGGVSAQRNRLMAQMQLGLDVATDAVLVGDAYAQAVSADRRVAVAEDALRIARATLEAVDRQVSAGLLAPADRRLAQLGVSQRVSDLHRARSAFRGSLLGLAPLLGCPPSTDWRVTDIDTSAIGIFVDRSDAVVEDLDEIAIKRMAVGEAEQALELARNALMPDLSLTLSVSDVPVESNAATGASSHASRHEAVVGLKLSIPLDDRDARGDVLVATQNLLRARLDLAQARLDAAGRVRRATQAIDDADCQRQLAREQLAHAESVFEDEEARLKLGKSTLLQLQTTQTSLASARVDLEDAELEIFRAKLHYLRTTGWLQPASGSPGLSEESADVHPAR